MVGILTFPEACSQKALIIADEEHRLQELKSTIGDSIRKSDGSEQARHEIAAITSAMQNATKVLAHAKGLAVQDFFKECPLNICKI